MDHDTERQQLVGRVVITLRNLKNPFRFEQDTFFGPDTFIEKVCGTTNQDVKLKKAMLDARAY